MCVCVRIALVLFSTRCSFVRFIFRISFIVCVYCYRVVFACFIFVVSLFVFVVGAGVFVVSLSLFGLFSFC